MNFTEIYNSSKRRTLTSLVLLFVILGIFLADNVLLTWVFFGIVYLVAFYESMSLFELKNNSYYVYAIAIWLSAYIYPNPDDMSFAIIIIALSFMAHKKDVNFKLLFPFVYPTISMLFLFTLYKDFGIYSLVWLVSIVAGSDVGAYVIGKWIGKTPFSKTSPNKTWEGTIGGICVATILGTLVGLGSVNIVLSLLISLLTALSSVWGDLFESYLKREAGVKDSGNIFPGHGGMLDRIDGYMFASIVMLILLRGLL
ncbi:MAG: phosphatidate cytidylyltransferase [Sulfurospirillaceae bacterium]|nr:phosphatidate cytidylyltransferase [Sulfurospirillaceae bacterium]